MTGANRFTIPLGLYWSKKTTSAHFFPATPPILAVGVTGVRPTMVELRNPSTEARLWVGWQQCDDPSDESNWTSATDLTGSYLSAVGRSHAVTAFEDISGSVTKRYVRFGFQVKNNTGTSLEVCHAGMVVDVRSV